MTPPEVPLPACPVCGYSPRCCDCHPAEVREWRCRELLVRCAQFDGLDLDTRLAIMKELSGV